MNMSKEELAATIEKYRQRADGNYQNYQESGIQRYQREYRKAEDMADTLQVALNASDDHADMIALRCVLAILGAKAQNLHTEHRCLELDYPDVYGFLYEIATEARVRGLIATREVRQ